jgi:hypothetical protein
MWTAALNRTFVPAAGRPPDPLIFARPGPAGVDHRDHRL